MVVIVAVACFHAHQDHRGSRGPSPSGFGFGTIMYSVVEATKY